MEHLELVLTRDRHPLCSFLTGLPSGNYYDTGSKGPITGCAARRSGTTNDDLD